MRAPTGFARQFISSVLGVFDPVIGLLGDRRQWGYGMARVHASRRESQSRMILKKGKETHGWQKTRSSTDDNGVALHGGARSFPQERISASTPVKKWTQS